MKTLEIIGFKRANLGKTEAKRLREESYVPGVLYGGEEQVHFYAPAILFRELIYTPEVHEVDLNIEGTHYRAILQDIQFHPVNEMILHADFLQLHEGKPVKIEVPVKMVGNSPGVMAGGKLVTKLRKLKVKALPANLPDFVEVDISGLELGKSIKVSKVKAENFEILTNPLAPVATVTIPRALKSAQAEEARAGKK
ncbi:MAG: 50S ribosomal protein L25/general stress protein Ctc [Hymenobacteraceae bacterium]|nr:50S ribosomal protein L25/general stress protein Ctc [Hymenobacteraceae bacterium]MDX5396187.1 50S ribosomal protein L25/general stress protein Ctc [Hymenobacteraceae bacterium]MDX5443554.1 50S ribosomal protein L25/general stress protein Ctc [Hymenobacteraceae bacterium]MDX5512249.1 50S ribosomal protein L25/general stress protein Ctc [Hymenobacteraceae bacterium]